MVELPEKKAHGWQSWPGVTVYTDLPVHKSCQGQGLENGGSAFLTLMRFMPNGVWGEYNGRVARLQNLRLHLIPALRRATGHFVEKDWPMVARALESVLSDAPPEHRASFHAILAALFEPLLSAEEGRFADEMLALFRGVASNKRSEWLRLRDSFEREGFRQYRRQVVDVIIRAFQKADALGPPLAFERMNPPADVREFQIFRDDLDVLKSLYVDLFELCSRALAYLGTVANLERRGDPEQWSDGRRRTLGRALSMRAVEREFVLGEFPECAKLYRSLDRHTRNDFGHCKVHYDFATGCLVDQDGREESFLLFLVDLLGAVRTSAIALLLVKFVDEEPTPSSQVP